MLSIQGKEIKKLLDIKDLQRRHVTGTSTRVLRYLDRPLTIAGKPYARSTEEVLTRVTDFNDEIHVRHWVDKNSVKFYNEQNVLRQDLLDTPFGSGRTDKQLAAKISRHLRLLRAHGIIRKLLKQNRYQLTLKGIKLTNILNAFLAASTEKLMKMAA